MVILDVGILSGFSLSPEDVVTTALIRKVDILPEKVILYLDSVSVSSFLGSSGKTNKLELTEQFIFVFGKLSREELNNFHKY